MSERKPTVLEVTEKNCYEVIATSDDPNEIHDAITGLGVIHLAMEPAKFKQAMKEIWAGAHGRTNIENLAIVAHIAGYLSTGYNDPFTLEYAAAQRADREAAKQPHAGEL